MPTGSRVRANNVFGLTTDNPLLAASVSFNSAGLVNLPSIGGTQHAVITLDPLRVNGAPEIVVVTAHTAAASVATITRGAYGTTARNHPQGTLWTHTPMDEDYCKILTSGTRPADPYRGEKIFETDTNRYVGRSTADVWQQMGLFFDPPACRITHNTTQAVGDAATITVAFNTEIFDTDSMHDNVTNNSRITINTAGLYLVGAELNFDAGADYDRAIGLIRRDGTTNIATLQSTDQDASFQPAPNGSTLFKFTAGQYIELLAFQDNTAGTPRNILSNADKSPILWAIWVGRGN